MDLAVWLRSLGLEQYEAAFRENAITEKVLPLLTAEDLKDSSNLKTVGDVLHGMAFYFFDGGRSRYRITIGDASIISSSLADLITE